MPRVPFTACLAGWAGDSLVEDYQSAAAGKKVTVSGGRLGGWVQPRLAGGLDRRSAALRPVGTFLSSHPHTQPPTLTPPRSLHSPHAGHQARQRLLLPPCLLVQLTLCPPQSPLRPPIPSAQATKRTRFSSFPPYLLVQLRRYYTSENWEAKKLDVRSEGGRAGGRGQACIWGNNNLAIGRSQRVLPGSQGQVLYLPGCRG